MTFYLLQAQYLWSYYFLCFSAGVGKITNRSVVYLLNKLFIPPFSCSKCFLQRLPIRNQQISKTARGIPAALERRSAVSRTVTSGQTNRRWLPSNRFGNTEQNETRRDRLLCIPRQGIVSYVPPVWRLLCMPGYRCILVQWIDILQL